MNSHTSSSPGATGVARALALVLTPLMILTAVAALLLFNLERQAFSAATYKQALINAGTYQQLPALLGEVLMKNIGSGAPAFAQQIRATQWTGLIKTLVPRADLQSMTEGAVDQVLAYLNGETQDPQLSLQPLKHSLAGQAGVDAIISLIQSWPDCTIQQLAKLLTSFGQELCNPPKELLDFARPLIQGQLEVMASALPDHVSLLVGLGSNNSLQAGLNGLKPARLAMQLSAVLPLAILLLITLLVVRSLPDLLAWWGWSFLLAGLLGTLVALAGAPVLRAVLESWLGQRVSLQLSPDLALSLREVVDASFREMLKPMVWESLGLSAAGIFMILGYFSVSRRQSRA